MAPPYYFLMKKMNISSIVPPHKSYKIFNKFLRQEEGFRLRSSSTYKPRKLCETSIVSYVKQVLLVFLYWNCLLLLSNSLNLLRILNLLEMDYMVLLKHIKKHWELRTNFHHLCNQDFLIILLEMSCNMSHSYTYNITIMYTNYS